MPSKYIYIYIRTYLHLPVESHVVHKAPFRVLKHTHSCTHTLRARRYNRIVSHSPIELNRPRTDRRYSIPTTDSGRLDYLDVDKYSDINFL